MAPWNNISSAGEGRGEARSWGFWAVALLDPRFDAPPPQSLSGLRNSVNKWEGE